LLDGGGFNGGNTPFPAKVKVSLHSSNVLTPAQSKVSGASAGKQPAVRINE
jgi:hypothetical protein